jgi:hypothetical protein
MCIKLIQDDIFAIKGRLFARLGVENHHRESHIRENVK